MNVSLSTLVVIIPMSPLAVVFYKNQLVLWLTCWSTMTSSAMLQVSLIKAI